MRTPTRITCLLSAALICGAAAAAQTNGQLPTYPRGRNVSAMADDAIAMGVTTVLETNDSVQTVDRCTRPTRHSPAPARLHPAA